MPRRDSSELRRPSGDYTPTGGSCWTAPSLRATCFVVARYEAATCSVGRAAAAAERASALGRRAVHILAQAIPVKVKTKPHYLNPKRKLDRLIYYFILHCGPPYGLVVPMVVTQLTGPTNCVLTLSLNHVRRIVVFALGPGDPRPPTPYGTPRLMGMGAWALPAWASDTCNPLRILEAESPYQRGESRWLRLATFEITPWRAPSDRG